MPPIPKSCSSIAGRHKTLRPNQNVVVYEDILETKQT